MRPSPASFDLLEPRRLLAWSSHAQLIGQDALAASAYTGAGTTVAVIDTGIDYTHPALGGGFGAGRKVIAGYDFYDDDDDPMDTSGHGTAVAGVVAADRFTHADLTYQGVAPGAKLVALRVGTDAGLSQNAIEQSLRWVLNNRARYDIGVVNLSLGSGNHVDADDTSRFADELAALRDAGVFVVAASGNSNDASTGPISQDGIATPAADPNVFAVAAVDGSDVISSWSQRGDELDLLAPGVDVVVPQLGGGYTTMSGTSFASPHVAGAAALVRQLDPVASPGDIASSLVAGGVSNRDGDAETGNTTTLQFSRLDLAATLEVARQRVGVYDQLNFGRQFDTALDAHGVLHAAWYDPGGARLLYATRDNAGRWSKAYIVDAAGDVGHQPSIAVDTSGKVAVAYFDATRTAVKYADFEATGWRATTVESDRHVGTSPSLQFDIDGHAHLAYYARSAGRLRLASLDRDSGAWTRTTVDGGNGIDVGKSLSLDVGEAEVRSAFGFTRYDTTVAIAYADTTNGNLKYARIDIDDPSATWYLTVVDDTQGVGSIHLDLHPGPLGLGLQAQIAYQDHWTADVKYAYRNTDWFVETVASRGKLGDTVQMFFDAADNPLVTYFDRGKRALFTASRATSGTWSSVRTAASSGPVSVALNERTGDAIASWLNRPRSMVFSSKVI
jgi:hypothetical protein